MFWPLEPASHATRLKAVQLWMTVCYWHFVIAVWVPTYFFVYWLPRLWT